MYPTPISDMLNSYAEKDPVRLHMPGHKGKNGGIYARDITELSFSDDLRNPVGVIARSQQNYAKLFGCKYCHYLVNGSSAGIFAMAMSVDNLALVEEGCHSSIIRALTVCGKNYVVAPIKQMNLKMVQKSVALYRFDAVFVTSPNYFGVNAELAEIYDFLHPIGIKLFVDSAHGAHFGLHELLPPNAVFCCDAAVESTHKTLGSLTQTAVLLTNDEDLSQRLKENLNATTTTSPSFLLLSSIEQAAAYAAEHAEDYGKLHSAVQTFKKEAEQLGYKFPKVDDFTRLVIDCSAVGDARKIYKCLEKRGIFCEFAQDNLIVAILTLYDDEETLSRLLKWLKNPVLGEPTQFDYVKNCFNGDF